MIPTLLSLGAVKYVIIGIYTVSKMKNRQRTLDWNKFFAKGR